MADLNTTAGLTGIAAADAEIADRVAQVKRLRAAFLRHIQTDNHCDRTGRSCRADRPCGCVEEMEAECNG